MPTKMRRELWSWRAHSEGLLSRQRPRLLLRAVPPIYERMALARLRIVVFPETSKTWAARALEHVLAGAGRTADAAVDTLLKIARAHVAYDLRHGREPLSAFAAAPQLYWSAFMGATKLANPTELVWGEFGSPLRCLVGIATQHPMLARYHPPARIA